MTETDKDAEEVPHERYRFDGMTLRGWVRCPQCHSDHVAIKIAEVERDEDEVAFTSPEVVWVECDSCGERSAPRRGLPVEQPDRNDGSLIKRIVGKYTP